MDDHHSVELLLVGATVQGRIPAASGARTMSESEHEPKVVVSLNGCLVKCSCGWATHPRLDDSHLSKREALAEWYRHYVQRRRAQPAP
jgi:hypothetical protein